MTKSKKNKPDKPKLKKIYRVVSTIITVAVFVFLVFIVGLIIWQKSSGKDTGIFGYYMFDVVTESMEPTIMTNDVILAKKTDADYIVKEGDIITFVAPSGVAKGYNITHRVHSIVYKTDGSGKIDYIKTAGDNKYGGNDVKVDDWSLKPAEIKAVYVKTMPAIGALRNFMKTPTGYVVLIVLPLLLVAVMIIIGFVKDRSKIEIDKLNEESKKKDVQLDDLNEEEKIKLLQNFLDTNIVNPPDTDDDNLN